MFLGHSLYFWLTVLGATLVRVLTTEYNGNWKYRCFRAALTAFCAIFAAVTFTDSLLHALSLPVETYLVPTAALLALTGEGLMRAVMTATKDFKAILAVMRAWRRK